jgi:hypothetical protein
VEPPDRLEKGIRFGCGFSFGVVFLIGCFLKSLWDVHRILAVCVLGGLVFGYVAMRAGDAFWESLLEWWRL